MTLVDVSYLIGLTGLLALSLRVLVAAVGGLRLTDPFLFVAAVAGSIAFPLWMFERVGAWAFLPLGVGAVWALVWAVRDVRGYRSQPRREPLGAFLFGKRPDGVRNWIALRPDSPKASQET